jgi:HD-GYP domain-containing protein (c-di-GMP phosphodiesterase class II)
MSERERLAVAAVAVLFMAAAAAVAAILPTNRDLDLPLALGLGVGYAVLSRIEFEIGSGYAVPDALLFVPMLFLLPVELVPGVVAVALVASRIPDFAARRTHVDRWMYGLSDAWAAIGPVLVVGLLAPGDPELAKLPVYVLAFAAQVLCVALSAMAVERVGIGDRAFDTVRATVWSSRVDGVLWPVGFMAAVAAGEMPLVLLSVAPLVWLLSVFSRERKQRYAAALELNRAYRGTVMLLSDVVESDDCYTAEHCRSVVELVMSVAEELDVDPDSRQELEFAALLHDVGKIAIPKEIINKPAGLTDAEFQLMKTHTIEGQQLLDRIGGLLGRVGTIVRSCHERWDGAGYPDGLIGTEIPLAARIVFGCDAFNAMTTDRPYRGAMSREAAVAELAGNSGTQFDPWVVDALLRVVERGDDARRGSTVEAVRAVLAGPELPRALAATR